MSDLKDNSSKEAETVPAPIPPPPGAGVTRDAESQTAAGMGTGVGNIVRRWRREDLLKKSSLAARAAALLFSLLAFIIMASNKHGDWKDFDKYEEYRYVLAVSILSTLYTALQAFRQLHELSTGKIFSGRNWAMIDFFGDQVAAYLLISSASSAVPLTNKMRENNDNIFTDSSASAISMEFLAFLAMAISAVISGYKLSHQSYI